MGRGAFFKLASLDKELDAIRSLYDNLATRYATHQSGRVARWILRDGHARAASHARGRLLEIGVGAGASFPYYAADVDITGIDLSPGMLAHAQKRLDGLGRTATLRVMDAQHLDFAESSFDSVAFNLVLCTIPDPIQALREACRVARRGASMTFLEHVRSNRLWVRIVEDALNPLVVRTSHDRINQDTEKLIRSTGIIVLSTERWFVGAMTLIVGQAP